eukprot:403350779
MIKSQPPQNRMVSLNKNESYPTRITNDVEDDDEEFRDSFINLLDVDEHEEANIQQSPSQIQYKQSSNTKRPNYKQDKENQQMDDMYHEDLNEDETSGMRHNQKIYKSQQASAQKPLQNSQFQSIYQSDQLKQLSPSKTQGYLLQQQRHSLNHSNNIGRKNLESLKHSAAKTVSQKPYQTLSQSASGANNQAIRNYDTKSSLYQHSKNEELQNMSGIQLQSHDEQSHQDMSNMSGGGYLSENSITRCKDFQQAYCKLQNQMSKHKYELMNSNYKQLSSSINNQIRNKYQNYGRNGHNNLSSMSENKGVGNVEIFDRLYKEKDRYLQTKGNSRDYKLEEELKECTFTPNSQRKREKSNQRSFNKLYNDILDAHQKTQQSLGQLRQKRFEDEMNNMRSFSSSSKDPSASKRELSPQQLSQKLYKEGVEHMNHKKYIATTKDLQKIDERYTFKPKISQKSQKLVVQKNPNRGDPNSLADKLFNEKLKIAKGIHQNKELKEVNSQFQLGKNSNKVLEQQIEKSIIETLSKLDFNQEVGLDAQTLNRMMLQMQYVKKGEEEKVTAVFNLIGNGNFLGFDELKTIVCGIEGIYLESFMKGLQLFLQSDGSSFTMPLDNQINFNKFKNIMREFKITKQQQEYESKLKNLSMISLSPKSDFKPKLTQKSVKMDQEKRQKSQSRQGNESTQNVKYDRATDLFAKGRMYQTQKLKKIEEKLESELDGCTFKPKVKTNYQFTEPGIIQRHNKKETSPNKKAFFNNLYQLAEPLKSRRDKSKDEYEFEKSQDQCTFVPKINKPKVQGKQSSKLQSQSTQSQNEIKPYQSSTINKSKINKPVQQQNSSIQVTQPAQNKKNTQERKQQLNEMLQQLENDDAVAGGKRLSLGAIPEHRRREIIKRNLIHQGLDESGQGQQLQRDQAPLLYLEVNISEGMQARLMVFDCDSYEEVVEIFADYYQIGDAKKIRLLEIVKLQLAKILQNIGEAQDEEEESNISKEYSPI